MEKTLAPVTQIMPTVEAETCKIMHNHFQTWFPEFKMWHISDQCFTDTFFSSVKFIHGYTSFQLCAFEKSGLMCHFSWITDPQSLSTLENPFRNVGAPLDMKSDNAPDFKGKSLLSNLWHAIFGKQFHWAYGRHGSFKTALAHFLHLTDAPLTYWCFALQHVSFFHSTWQDVVLIDNHHTSVFRFLFWPGSSIFTFTPVSSI